MDLSTRYLGLELAHPVVAGAGPPTSTLDGARRLEDAGAAALVLPSLFEEELRREEVGTIHHMERHTDSFAESLSFFPDSEDFQLGPQEHLRHVRAVKDAVAIPVIASLNGNTPEGWLRYALLLEEAGADALELNIYEIEASFDMSPSTIENRMISMFESVRKAVKIPIAVKFSHFHTAIPHLARRLDEAGADGLVLFNRFYQPDIDIEELETRPHITLSQSHELLLRLRWIALLSDRIDASLAAIGGVHEVEDVVKALLVGADVTQCVSGVLKHGPDHLGRLRDGLGTWLEEHEYDSLDMLRGSMNLSRCPDPTAYERANYIQTLLSWRGTL